MSQRDLLEYLGRYEALGDRVVRRVDRWRRRGWTFARVAAEAERVAAALAARGVRPGDRVALHLEDGPLWHAAFFGVLRAGAVAVPLDVSLEPPLLRELTRTLELRAWCTEREVPELALDLPRVELDWRVAGRSRAGDRAAAPVDDAAAPVDDPAPPWPDDDPARLAQIVLTSGTSGAPKAVPVTHANMRVALDAIEAAVAPHRRWLRVLPRFRVAVLLPLSHLYGQVMGVFAPAILGSDVACLPPMPPAEIARALRRDRAWSLASVPRTLALLADHLRAAGERAWGADGFARRLEEARALPWWRRWIRFRRLHREVGYRMLAIVSGGAALDPEVEALYRTLGFAVVQGYGLTETAPLVTLEHPLDSAPGSLGRPLPGVEVQIAPDSEILVRGANVVPARLGGPAVDAEGWLHTGDLGRLTEGRLFYLGRKGERIVTPAGVNVDPDPIVARLAARSEVRDALVLERPWGRPGAVCAVVVARPGADAAAAIAAVNAELPDAARIRAWYAWPGPDFPRTRTGKPRHAEVRAWVAGLAHPVTADRDASHAAAGASTAAPTDPVAALAAMAAAIAGVPAADISPDARLGDVLASLDRIELATRLETAYGVTLGMDALAGDRTVRETALEAFAPAEPREIRAAAASPDRPAKAPDRPAEAPDRPAPPRERPARTPAAEARWRHLLAVRFARRILRDVVARALFHPAIDTRSGGVEHVAAVERPFLIAANHLSILDGLPILYALPARLRAGVAPTAMWEHFRRGRRWQYVLAVAGLDMIPLVQVGDWRATLRVAGMVCDRGGCPLVFPEGARSDDGQLLPFHPGVAVMARELHLPIVPCALMGTLAVMPRGAKWFHRCWTRRAPVAVRFGAAMEPPRPDDDPRAVVAELARRIEVLRREALAAAGRP